jgi:hypothetical protein
MKNVNQKHKAVGEEFLFPDAETTIRLAWENQNKYWWNEVCADVVKVFGLPGDRFTSHPTPDYMDFHFKSKKDADLCRIMLSEKL